MKMYSRKVWGYKTEPGMLAGLMLAGSGWIRPWVSARTRMRLHEFSKLTCRVCYKHNALSLLNRNEKVCILITDDNCALRNELRTV